MKRKERTSKNKKEMWGERRQSKERNQGGEGEGNKQKE
jgi:hypothetical protein